MIFNEKTSMHAKITEEMIAGKRENGMNASIKSERQVWNGEIKV